MVFLKNGKTYDTTKDECIIKCRNMYILTKIYKTKQKEYYYTTTSHLSIFTCFGLLTKEQIKEIKKSKEFDFKKMRGSRQNE